MVRLIRHLSIDVALGAAVMMAFTAKVFDVEVEGIYYFLLSLITWLIYTTDHLMDARNIPHEASTPRHRFHQVHYKPILSAAIIGLFLFISLIPRETGELLFRLALGLAGMVLLYFLSLIWARKTKFRYVLKEVFIALCYTLGVALVPTFLAWPLEIPEFIFLLLIFLLALANLFIFSVREMKVDFQDENPSAIRFMGLKTLKLILQIVLWLQLSGSLYLFWKHAIAEGAVLLGMNLILMLLCYSPERFAKNETYRLMGDGIFLLPAIWLIIDKIF